MEQFFVPPCEVIAFDWQDVGRHVQGCIAIPAVPSEVSDTEEYVAVAMRKEGDTRTHLIRSECIERSIVHANHDICRGWCAVGTRQGEPPLLLLSGLQMVAEGVPAHREPCLGLFKAEVKTFLLEVSFVDEECRDSQMMLEAFFVRHLYEHRLVGEVQQGVAHDAVLAIDDAVNPCIGQGGAYLEAGWLFGRDGVARCVEPQVVLANETLVGDGEDGEAGFIRCGIAR